VGVSIGDTLAALHGVIGIFAALEARRKTGRGQVIDVALHESVFNVMESLLPEYTEAGVIREPAGSALPGITPSNAYPCSDGLVLVAGNGDGIFRRLMEVMGRLDLRDDPSLSDNAGRNLRAAEIDAAIAEWTQARDVNSVIEVLQAVRVPVGRIYTAKDIAEDDHYRARDMILETQAYDGLPVHQPGIVPKLSETPGQIRSRAPRIGEHTQQVLEEAGFTPHQIAELRAQSIIA
jgi:formyl-CoA transferase